MRFTLVILFLGNICFAQQIDNRQCGAFTDMPFFNVQFMKNNGVKAIRGSISFKKELDIIRKQDLIQIFEFDSLGRQTSSINTFKSITGKKDTAIVYYEYEGINLILRRKSDTYGFFSDNYKFDSADRVIKKTYCRDDNAGPDKFHFELKKQYVIVSEEYKYEQASELVLKRLHFNNYKRSFKEELIKTDDNGYLKEITSKTVIGNRRSKTTFEYDYKGQVFKKVEQLNLDKANKTRNEYIYDDLGNLIEHNYYKNGIHKIYRKLLYNGKTMLLETQLSKNMSTNTITITKYVYEFY